MAHNKRMKYEPLPNCWHDGEETLRGVCYACSKLQWARNNKLKRDKEMKELKKIAKQIPQRNKRLRKANKDYREEEQQRKKRKKPKSTNGNYFIYNFILLMCVETVEIENGHTEPLQNTDKENEISVEVIGDGEFASTPSAVPCTDSGELFLPKKSELVEEVKKLKDENHILKKRNVELETKMEKITKQIVDLQKITKM